MSNNNKYSKKDPKNRGSKSKYNKKFSKKRTSDDDSNATVTSTTNDISWYNGNPQLVADAARIPMGNQLGRAIDGTSGFGIRSVPGVCAIKVVPGPGIADSVTDAVNISATNIFQYIRKNLSTYASYSAADVMMYIMAVDELYAWYNYVSRIFGIANNFSAVNLYTPTALLHANGMNWYDIENLRENFNDYRAKFNSLIYKAASIYMPVDISIVKRHMWMFGNYFVDSKSAKAQSYIYVPAGWHTLDETSDENGTMLKFNILESPDRDGFSMGEMLDVFNNMIESIRGSDSMLKIAADMRRAYENSSSWQLSYIPEGFMIIPTHDETVLHQIMNTIAVDKETFLQDGVFDIKQSVEHNKIIYKPQVEGNLNPYFLSLFATFTQTHGPVLNFHKPDVSAEDIVEATRNMTLYQVDNFEDPSVATIVSSGADIAVGISYFVKNPEGTGDFAYDKFDARTSLTYTTTGGNIVTTPGPMPLSIIAHAFDWSPTMYICNFADGKRDIVPFCAYDNYTQVKWDNLKLLHEAVLTSMWQVPDFRLPTAGNKVKK